MRSAFRGSPHVDVRSYQQQAQEATLVLEQKGKNKETLPWTEEAEALLNAGWTYREVAMDKPKKEEKKEKKKRFWRTPSFDVTSYWVGEEEAYRRLRLREEEGEEEANA